MNEKRDLDKPIASASTRNGHKSVTKMPKSMGELPAGGTTHEAHVTTFQGFEALIKSKWPNTDNPAEVETEERRLLCELKKKLDENRSENDKIAPKS